MRLAAFLPRALRSTVAIAVIVGALSAAVAGVATSVSSAVFSAVASVVSRVAAVDTIDARHRRTVARLDSELATAKAEIANLQKPSTVRYRGSDRTLREAAKDTSDRVSRRVSRAAARNLAAMPMEAAPIIGAGVIVAATAWELNDACELLKDMRELELAFDPGSGENRAQDEVCGAEVPTRAELQDAVTSSPERLLDEISRQYGDVFSPRLRDSYELALSWWGHVAGAEALEASQ